MESDIGCACVRRYSVKVDRRVAHPFGEPVSSFEVSGAASLCRVCKGCVFWFWSGAGDYLRSRSGGSF